MVRRHRPGSRTTTHSLTMTIPEAAAPFASDDDLLAMAAAMFKLREEFTRKRGYHSEQEPEVKELEERAFHARRTWHRSVVLTGSTTYVGKLFTKHCLNQYEKEVVVILLLHQMSMLDLHRVECGDLVNLLAPPVGKVISVLRYLSEEGRLIRTGLIAYADTDEELKDRELVLDPVIFDTIIYTGEHNTNVFPVKAESEMRPYLARLVELADRKNEAFRDHYFSVGYTNKEVYKRDRTFKRFYRRFRCTLREHPEWLLSRMEGSMRYGDFCLVLILLGREYQFKDGDDDLFEGAGLAAVISGDNSDFGRNLARLGVDGYLIKNSLVQPSGGFSVMLHSNPDDIKETEYELTPACLEQLGVDRKQKKKRQGYYHLRDPRVTFDQLVLPAKVNHGVDMAVTQSLNGDVLFRDWGLASIIHYGRGVTLLFSGPPGTGKTATAEALAGKLGKQVLIADYSKIQNCFVGQTEKNIVRVFQEAAKEDAVLLWDEADAMFFDRDQAGRNWEVRDVNVLLQEIERFEGVCILTTNRSVSLDKALERRITIKLVFDKPDREAREKIWRNMLPDSLPLADDVTPAWLSNTGLTGGEIKNVLLNAARLALMHEDSKVLTRMIFEQAVGLEREGRISGVKHSTIGFTDFVSCSSRNNGDNNYK